MAFGALLFSSFIPIQQIGGLMVLAMLATSIGTLTLMASIIELLKNKLINNNLEK
jgi:predicted RND superfamily exporter protein